MPKQTRKHKQEIRYDVSDDQRKKQSAGEAGPTHISSKQKCRIADQNPLEDPQIVVAIDFGTTFLGYAYALPSDPDSTYTFHNWPCQAEAGVRQYCKTQSSLWYLPREDGTFYLKDWGWAALVNYTNALQAATNEGNPTGRSDSTCGLFLTKFKLHFGPEEEVGEDITGSLPEGLGAERVALDYLRELGKIVKQELKHRYGSFIQTMKDVKWCLTVPTMWTEASKQRMIDCMEMAGLLCGRRCPPGEDASRHQIEITSEPEAALIYCQQIFQRPVFKKGSKLLIVDVGGGTVNLVVQEKVSDFGLPMKELTSGSGLCCGGTYVDEAFRKHLVQRIDCFEKFSAENPSTVLRIMGLWDSLKSAFDVDQERSYLSVPRTLARAWHAHNKTVGRSLPNPDDDLVLTRKDMESIFEREVTEILKLIQDQINILKEKDEWPLDAMFVVGGFSNSGYLMARIREGFSSQVEHILRPPVPESAVVQGAAALGCFRLSKFLSAGIEAQERSDEQHRSAGAEQQAARCSARVARN